MAKGAVKWFDTKKGYGFIKQPGGEDIFVHYSGIEGDGFKTLRAGEEVDQQEPMAWTTVGTPTACEAALPRVRLTVGDSVVFEIDELRIGTTWHSVRRN